MVRSSKPKRREPPYILQLTAGGDAELIEPYDGETVWNSREDQDFRAEFPDFLTRSDLFDILDFLEDTGELTANEADQCECVEQSLTAADLTGFMRAE